MVYTVYVYLHTMAWFGYGSTEQLGSGKNRTMDKWTDERMDEYEEETRLSSFQQKSALV